MQETSPALAPLLAHLHAEPSRTGSLLVSFFGDAVVPRGGCVWIGTMMEVCEGLGVGAGVVRTALSRLAADGWVDRHKLGRNSFYRLGPQGLATFAAADARIYGPPPHGDGRVRLVLAQGEAAKEALQAAGFAMAAPGVWVAPAGLAVPAAAGEGISLFAGGEEGELRRLARQAWPLDRLEAAYRRFLTLFEPMAPAHSGAAWTGQEAMLIRLLLVHEYRRIRLRDPLLPPALLDADWPGAAARALCVALYPAVLAASEQWLDAHGRSEDGPLPPPETSLFRRFQPE